MLGKLKTALPVVALGAFAVSGAVGAEAFVTPADAAEISTNVIDNAKIMIPVGLGIIAIMMGIKAIPKVLNKFF